MFPTSHGCICSIQADLRTASGSSLQPGRNPRGAPDTSSTRTTPAPTEIDESSAEDQLSCNHMSILVLWVFFNPTVEGDGKK